MGIKRKLQTGFIVLTLFCIVAACTGAAPTEESLPPADTPVPVSPTAEPEEQPASGWTSYQGAKIITDMVFDNDGNLWTVGVMGIYQLDPNDQNQEAKPVEHDFISNNFSSIAVAKDGFLWVGTRGHGVAKFDGETWTSYTVEDGLADNYVMTIDSTSDGAVWFGTFEYDGGVSRFEGNSWITYNEADGLAEKYVTDIEVTSDDNLWFGTYSSGVSFFDGDNWITYTTNDGLVQNWIVSITSAPDGTLWVGTLDKGVSRFDGSNWVTYTESDGLINNTVNSIEVAPDGTVWFATNIGVSSFDGTTWTTYTEEDGLINNKTGSILVGPDGALWFGTNKGISRYIMP